MLRTKVTGKWISDVYIPRAVIRLGLVRPGDAKVSDHFSNSYTLGNGWEAGDTFKVETLMKVWAKNAARNADPEECADTGSDTYTIPQRN